MLIRAALKRSFNHIQFGCLNLAFGAKLVVVGMRM